MTSNADTLGASVMRLVRKVVRFALLAGIVFLGFSMDKGGKSVAAAVAKDCLDTAKANGIEYSGKDVDAVNEAWTDHCKCVGKQANNKTSLITDTPNAWGWEVIEGIEDMGERFAAMATQNCPAVNI